MTDFDADLLVVGAAPVAWPPLYTLARKGFR